MPLPSYAIQSHCSSELNGSVPWRYRALQFLCCALLRSSIPPLFHIITSPWPFQSPRNFSPAVLVPSQLSSAPAFLRYSSPPQNCSSPCYSNAYPFRTMPLLVLAMLFRYNSTLFFSMPFHFSSEQRSSSAFLFNAVPLPISSRPCNSTAIHRRCSSLRFSVAHLCHSHLCHCISMLRFSTAFPIQSGQCYSDATLTGSPHFLCWP